MKVRVEISSLATRNISGVGHYTKRLTEALDQEADTNLTACYFNFRNRQPKPSITLRNPLDENTLVPLRIYSKLQSYNLAPPFDLFKSKVDLTIFPNFATWPNMRSQLTATVIHDLTYLRFPEVVERKNLPHLRRVVPRSIQKADFIITVSEAVRSELIEQFHINPDLIVATPIPPEASYYTPNINDIHRKYKLPSEKFIFSISTLEPRKNLATLVEAYRKLPQDTKDQYCLVLAGGRGWKTETTQQAIDSAIVAGEKVIHVGYIDQADAPAFYQKASLLVVPSLYEGFGMPVVEALASGTPVVASDIPVLREAAGRAALYANPSSPTEFCEKIELILSSAQIREQLLSHAQTQLQKFSWQENARKIIKLAEGLL